MSNLINLTDSTDVSLVGVKAARLAQLAQSNFIIPKGFVIPASLTIEDGLSNDIQNYLSKLAPNPLILRISAPKDSTTTSAALSEVTPENILNILTHAKSSNPDSALIIQEFLDAEIWGTTLSVNPQTNAKNEIYITSSPYSIADPNPSHILLLDKTTGSILAEHEKPTSSFLTPDHLESLCSSTLEIERIFHQPIRIKFGFDTGILHIIGVKPI
ncbi:MAG: hypothetical protein LBT19_00320 [Candidatus Nomurabacteria bacterium]|jgi:hypothetical protein|nr:hypothetical protein [Candidatus Nomurabacteria bacterium]